MTFYLIYDPTSGSTESSMSCPDESFDKNMELRPGMAAVESTKNPENYWVDIFTNPVVTKEKIDNPCYLDGATIYDIPNPSTVTVFNGGPVVVEVTDGQVTLEPDNPREYRVLVEPDDPQYRVADFTVRL